MPNMNNLRNRIRLLATRGTSDATVPVTVTSNGMTLRPSDHDTISNWTMAGQETATSHATTIRQMGCHKDCCGGFCLGVGSDVCCAHASSRDDNHNDDDDDNRFCSFCYDRKREERKNLKRLMTQQRLGLLSEQTSSNTTRSRSTLERGSEEGIPKPCCGYACSGLSYTHCCEHNDQRFSAVTNRFYLGMHHSVLPSDHWSFCVLCRERCRQRDCLQEIAEESQEDDSSVSAVRLMPVPPGRTAQNLENNPIEAKAPDPIEFRGDLGLEQCVTKCLSSIECPLCLEPYAGDPCTLPCGHSMCLAHLYKMDRCPICRWILEPDWIGNAQPSIALREAAAAVRQAVDLLISMKARLQQSEALVCSTLDDDNEDHEKGETIGQPVGSELQIDDHADGKRIRRIYPKRVSVKTDKKEKTQTGEIIVRPYGGSVRVMRGKVQTDASAEDTKPKTETLIYPIVARWPHQEARHGEKAEIMSSATSSTTSDDGCSDVEESHFHWVLPSKSKSRGMSADC